MRATIVPGVISKNSASSVPIQSPTRLVWLAGCPGPAKPPFGRNDQRAPATVTISQKCGSSKVAGMAYDVARVRGLHPSLGDGWVHFDAQSGMLLPDSVATTVSTSFRGSMRTTVGTHPSAQRSAAVLDSARRVIADLVNGDPR